MGTTIVWRSWILSERLDPGRLPWYLRLRWRLKGALFLWTSVVEAWRGGVCSKVYGGWRLGRMFQNFLVFEPERGGHSYLMLLLLSNAQCVCVIFCVHHYYVYLYVSLGSHSIFIILFLVYIYIDDLFVRLQESGIGCKMGDSYAGCLGYADDLSLLAPTKKGLQKIIDIFENYANEFEILFNANKSQFLIFEGKGNIHKDCKLRVNGILCYKTLRKLFI